MTFQVPWKYECGQGGSKLKYTCRIWGSNSGGYEKSLLWDIMPVDFQRKTRRYITEDRTI
jgi:hypothetical protein